MSDHHCLCPRLNQAAIYFSICRIPLITGKIIYACKNVLIHFIAAIPWEMLNCNKNIFFLSCPHVIETTCKNTIRIIPICTHVCNRISPISININHRCKSPVTTNRCTFTTAYFSEPICILRVSSCRNLHLFSVLCSICCNSAASILKISSNKKWDLTVFLQITVCPLHFLRLTTTIHNSTNVMCEHDMFQILWISGIPDWDKQLTYFFF